MASLQTEVTAAHCSPARTVSAASYTADASAQPEGDQSEAVTAYEIVQRLGGRARIAQCLGIGANTVSAWNVAGIPAIRVPQLFEIAQRDGLADLSYSVLHRAAARPPRPKAPAGSGPIRSRRKLG